LWLSNKEISGKTLFVYLEQGFGDIFQFFHFLKLLQKTYINVIFQAERSVPARLKHMSNDPEIIGTNDQILGFNFYCSLLNLPLYFKTFEKQIPPNGCANQTMAIEK
tara:strand:- start:53 stop:373 length:321 start_codon:yes stop_codon:yes gene_type:complete